VWKSGALVSMACQVGAAVATDDPEVLRQIGCFGQHVGVAAQLLNDIAGLDPADGAVDLARRKKTLPVAYALRCAREESWPGLRAWFDATLGGQADGAAVGDLATQIRQTGALHYAWVVADAHRRAAFASLREVSRASGRAEVSGLRRLVPRLPVS
jgi:geranylgeranyl diphosphate synthase type I